MTPVAQWCPPETLLTLTMLCWIGAPWLCGAHFHWLTDHQKLTSLSALEKHLWVCAEIGERVQVSLTLLHPLHHHLCLCHLLSPTLKGVEVCDSYDLGT